MILRNLNRFKFTIVLAALLVIVIAANLFAGENRLEAAPFEASDEEMADVTAELKTADEKSTDAAGINETAIETTTETAEEEIPQEEKETQPIIQSDDYTASNVYLIQDRLSELGYLQGDSDGSFGPMTKMALKQFQVFNGVEATGNLDQDTCEQLNASEPVKAELLKTGIKGEAVSEVQHLLNDLGFPIVYEDGTFDEATENGVEMFQRRRGLSVDGIVGKRTMEALLTASADEGWNHRERPEKLKGKNKKDKKGQSDRSSDILQETQPHVTESGSGTYDTEVENMAAQVLDEVGWDLYNAFCWSANIPYGWSEVGYTTSQVAAYSFANHIGDCVGKATTFYWMAKLLGYDADVIYGYVPLKTGEYGEHAWVEINLDGDTYVCDPEYEWNVGQDGFLFQYREPGTWRYEYGYVMNDW